MNRMTAKSIMRISSRPGRVALRRMIGCEYRPAGKTADGWGVPRGFALIVTSRERELPGGVVQHSTQSLSTPLEEFKLRVAVFGKRPIAFATPSGDRTTSPDGLARHGVQANLDRAPEAL